MRSLLMLLFCFCLTTIHAQKMSWRKHAKLADKQFEAGNFADAATNYEAAWNKKKKKKQYIYKAAECYLMLKDYQKAAAAYEHVKEENKDFILPGLKYCRALKMDGRFDEASRAFVYFINGYTGDDKDVVAEIVQDEIRGCELALSMQEQKTAGITFEHLADNINSKGADFAPVPFSDDVLYYTSNMVGETKMYLSQKKEGFWTRSRIPKNFPKINAAHFGNGAFSPDNKSFFYSQCDQIDATGRMMQGCQIYVTHREEGGWSAPVKLGSNVNRAGSTATHPFVVHEGNKETLYFVSDRKGGRGGLDIWYTTRDLTMKGKMKYTNAKNMGPTINSIADEITPYFDMEENMLYFSSNGKVNIGGFDIFKSKKEDANLWEKPENVGLPYNSSADDYYFRKYASNGGYVVSNRQFGLEKTDYGNDDIFAFSTNEEIMMASGMVMDNATNQPIADVSVALYEVLNDGNARLLENKFFEDGKYEFKLLPGKNYKVEANQEGYVIQRAEFSTMNNEMMTFENDFTMSKAMMNNPASTIANNTNATSPTTTMNSGSTMMNSTSTMNNGSAVTSTTPAMSNSSMTNNTTTTTSTSVGTANGTFNNPQPNTQMMEDESFASDSGSMNMSNSSPTSTTVNSNTSTTTLGEAGVVYKIQLSAVRVFDISSPRYRKPRNYGELETEYLPNKDLTRVLLGRFATKEEAKEVLKTMKKERAFRSAVVVRYENGVRIDPWAK